MKNHKLILSLLISLSFLCLAGCCVASTDTPTPIPTLAYDTGPDFECWRAPGNQNSLLSTKDEIYILLNSPDPNSRMTNLYRYHPVEEEYQLAGTLENAGGETTASPMRNAFGIESANSKGSNYWVFDVSRNEFINIPDKLVGVYNYALDWSPNGNCVFLPQRNSVIAFRISDGTIQKKSFPDIGWDFDVSPNGQWWAWGTNEGIVVKNLDGEEIKHTGLEANFGAYRPRWSPDGKYLAFAYNTRKVVPKAILPIGIRLVEFEGDQITSYRDSLIVNTDSIIRIEWTADSHQIYFNIGSRIQVYDINKDQETEINTLVGENDIGGYCTSVDGTELFFYAYYYQANSKLFYYDFETEKIEQIPWPEGYTNENHVLIYGIYCAIEP